MTAMRIGIDATCWTNWRGYGRFTRSLVAALLEVDRDNEYVLFFDRSYGGAPLARSARQVIVETSRPQATAASADGRRSFADIARMSGAVAREALDVFFCPSVYSFFPLLGRFRKVVAVHDAIAENHPELIFPTKRGRALWTAKVWLALRQADCVVTVSEHARRDVSRAFGIQERSIPVIPEAPAEVFRPPASIDAARAAVASRHGIDRPYVLYVGGFGPHKNVARLVDAFGDSAAAANHVLLLVGERDRDPFYSTSRALEQKISKSGLEARVRFLGFQPDEDLRLLYQAADVLVLPSVREGYGLPGVEAMACGAPVIGTRESALPEVLGDAGRFVDPSSTPELGRALADVLGDGQLRDRMRAAARDRSARLTWRRAAEATLEVFSAVVAR